MSLPPVEIPLGSIRFNSESQKLEYWNGSIWMQIHTFSPDLDGGVRGTFHGGETPTRVDTIDYITITTAGNAIDFGNISTGVLRANSACSSNTRAIICSGEDGNTPRPVDLRFITFSSTGDTTDFGDLTVGTRGSASLSNQTRGITANGSTPSYPGTVDFYTIASTGNANDFGDQVTARASSGVASSPTRGLFAGGYNPSTLSSIEFVQIATTGNRVNFGNLDQTVSGLVVTPDIQDSYDVTVDLIDPNDDSDASTVPNVKIKVTGTTSTTVHVHETLVVGSNVFRFGADDTTVKIEIIPQAYNTPNFDIDNISLKQKTVAEPLTNAPINNKGIVVTEERFIFALGAGGNSRKVQWCDKENNTQWTALSTNEVNNFHNCGNNISYCCDIKPLKDCL